MAAVLQVFGELLVSVAPEAAAAATGSEWLAVGKAQGRCCDFGSTENGLAERRRIKGSRAYDLCDRGL